VKNNGGDREENSGQNATCEHSEPGEEKKNEQIQPCSQENFFRRSYPRYRYSRGWPIPDRTGSVFQHTTRRAGKIRCGA